MQPAALITGSARRIGRTIALTLARRGYDIALHYNRSAGQARQTAEEIRSAGRDCRLFQADLSDAGQIRRLMEDVFSALPDCNVLVNNASIFERGRLLEMDERQLDRHVSVNFKAPVLLSQEFARRCRQGNIVNILDTKIVRATINYFAYALSKKALAAFTLMAARDLAPGIRVNGVCPGLTLPAEDRPAGYMEALAESVPLKRTGNPQQVADAIVYLLENDYVTGQILFVDGGEHIG